MPLSPLLGGDAIAGFILFIAGRLKKLGSHS